MERVPSDIDTELLHEAVTPLVRDGAFVQLAGVAR